MNSVLELTFLSGRRLGREMSIQMVTALVLQLIQCSAKIPDNTDTSELTEGEEDKKPVSAKMIVVRGKAGTISGWVGTGG